MQKRTNMTKEVTTNLTQMKSDHKKEQLQKPPKAGNTFHVTYI